MAALPAKVGCYTTAAETEGDGQITTFFLLDEVGARMGQANVSCDQQPEPENDAVTVDERQRQQQQQPNYRCLPFFSLDDRVAYSVGAPQVPAFMFFSLPQAVQSANRFMSCNAAVRWGGLAMT